VRPRHCRFGRFSIDLVLVLDVACPWERINDVEPVQAASVRKITQLTHKRQIILVYHSLLRPLSASLPVLRDG
jgi:hypothetical protein